MKIYVVQSNQYEPEIEGAYVSLQAALAAHPAGSWGHDGPDFKGRMTWGNGLYHTAWKHITEVDVEPEDAK